MTMTDLNTAVFELLDNAKSNGYTGSDGTLMHTWSDEDIALDMLAYATFEEVVIPKLGEEGPTVAMLTVEIAEWRAIHDKRE